MSVTARSTTLFGAIASFSERFSLKRLLGKVSLSTHFLFAFALAFLFIAMPMAAQAQTAMATINVSTLGADADNNGVAGASQWIYTSGNGVLWLNTTNGNYTLTGSNPNIRVQIPGTTNNVNVTFNDLNAMDFRAEENCTITLTGTNTLTRDNAVFFVRAGRTCTINGSGSLAITATAAPGGQGIVLQQSSNLHIAGTARVTVNAVGTGIATENAVSINIGAGATLAATAYTALAINSDFALVCNGNATFTGASGFGIAGSGTTNPTFSGGGTVTATGGASGRAISLPNANHIMMGDGLTMVMTNNNSSVETKTFERTTASAYQWAVTGATTTAGGGSNATVAISIAPGATGTVARASPISAYTALQNAASAASCIPNVLLAGNITGNAQLTIACNFTLDLNGRALTIDLPPAVGAAGNGIKINPGITLTIMDSSSPSAGRLTVTNGANINNSPATNSNNGAAINSSEGTLIINSGTVNATGGRFAAGIGGGDSGAGGTITINGGTVTASSVDRGAGIGGGYSGAGGTITINGGTITANCGTSGAGIGGGDRGAGGTITISGTADVTANGSIYGAGIGGGWDGMSGFITISGNASVTASGGESGADGNGGGAGIGSGGTSLWSGAAVNSITINTTGTVTASGGAASTTGTGRAGAAIGQGGNGSNRDGAGINALTHPTPRTVAEGQTAAFAVAVTPAAGGLPTAPTYQWQVASGGAFANVTNGVGATTANYTTIATTAAMNGNRYRSVVSASNVNGNGTGTITIASLPAMLTIGARTPVSWSSLTANGASGTTTTSALSLTFDVDPTTLQASNITVTGATRGALSGTGTTRTLAISNITVANGDNVTVTISNPAGFALTPLSRNVAVYRSGGGVTPPPTIPVTGITVSGAGNATAIASNGGTLQMAAAVLPADASNNTVSWSVIPGTGSATISSSGLLTAVSNGVVTVRATANDGSGIFGTLIVTISGQTGTGTTYPLTVSVNPAGSGTVNIASGNYAAAHSFTNVMATANPGYQFSNWSISGAIFVGGSTTATANPTAFAMPAGAATLTANFVPAGGTSDPAADAIQKAYIAFFNRPADVPGMTYWKNYPGNMQDMLTEFSQSAEYLSDYAGFNNQWIISKVYQNLFGRLPEPVGLNYWSAQMEAGWITIANVAYEILGGAQNEDKTIIENKVKAANTFTNGLDTPVKVEAYNNAGPMGLPNAAKTWLAAVNENDASVDEASTKLPALIQQLVDRWEEFSGQ